MAATFHRFDVKKGFDGFSFNLFEGKSIKTNRKTFQGLDEWICFYDFAIGYHMAVKGK